jgi:FkbM family methyltransferase
MAIRTLPSRYSYRLIRTLLHGGNYGLNAIDRRLIEILQPERQSGFYVELGANDGLRQPNSYLLQQRYGWGGLLIEPSPVRFVKCVRNRSFGQVPAFRCAACVDFAYSAPFVVMEYSDLMSVALDLDLKREEALRHAQSGLPYLDDAHDRHRFGAEVRTLTALLDEVSAPAEFNLLSLDVEGNELTVLRGLDLTRHRPRCLLAECPDHAVPHHLKNAGYRQREILNDSSTYLDILFSPT